MSGTAFWIRLLASVLCYFVLFHPTDLHDVIHYWMFSSINITLPELSSTIPEAAVFSVPPCYVPLPSFLTCHKYFSTIVVAYFVGVRVVHWRGTPLAPTLIYFTSGHAQKCVHRQTSRFSKEVHPNTICIKCGSHAVVERFKPEQVVNGTFRVSSYLSAVLKV